MSGWLLMFSCGHGRDYRLDYAEQNPATKEWTCAGQRKYATVFPTYEAASEAAFDVIPSLAREPWHVPRDAWRIELADALAARPPAQGAA